MIAELPVLQVETKVFPVVVDPEVAELMRQIELRKIDRGRTLTIEKRFRAGADLYDDGMDWMRSCIKGMNPDWSEKQVQAEVDRRKRIARRIDDAGLFQPFVEVPRGQE